jgi:hypothetical protein
MNTKKTAFGIAGAAAATLITVGLAAPAMASTPDGHSSSSHSSTSSSQYSYEQMITRVTEILNGNSSNAPVVVSPQIGIGDVASGNALGSGNTTSIPILSGNETALGSGNTTSVGNGTSVLNGSGNGASASTSAGNANGSGNSSSVTNSTGNIGDQVNTTVNGILGGLGLSSH